ncbi:MAG: hypothetical protein JNL25_00370 [Rhodospirillaceae bacterium]|nr:hypothetical protein [Rhodospirillaceae bacterium]
MNTDGSKIAGAWRTRDRRAITALRCDPETREIRGEVAMVGACRWRADGRILQAGGSLFSGNHAGPLDLVPDHPAAGPGPRHASIRAALDDPDARSACCD